MAHYSRLSKLVIDVPPADHDRELTFWSGCIAMSGTAGWSSEPPGEGAHALVFFADAVRVELADSERSDLGMLDVHDLSRCRVQRNFEASS